LLLLSVRRGGLKFIFWLCFCLDELAPSGLPRSVIFIRLGALASGTSRSLRPPENDTSHQSRLKMPTSGYAPGGPSPPRTLKNQFASP
jgi:hypothetical protein